MPDEKTMNPIIINGIFTLIGVLLGSLIPMIKDLIALRSNKNIEYIRLHDKDRIEAYKVLFEFIYKLRITIWPDNPTVYGDFKLDCQDNLRNLIPKYPYYSKNVLQELSKLESLYNMTIIDVAWVNSPKDEVEKELPKIVNKLYDIVLDDFRKWNI